MKLTTFAQSLHDLNHLKDAGYEEVILGVRELSRFGKIPAEDFASYSARAKELSLRVILEWDILMTEETFQSAIPVVEKLLPLTDALRVQDPGALKWSLDNCTLPLQFIAETGNHNLEALKGWKEISGSRLERFVLSIELSRETLAHYVTALNVPCELLGLGRILLFYTPRSLLTPLSPERQAVNEEIHSLGESEESPHKGFPVLENRHGTFMFHIKEFCLLEYAQDLRDLGLAYFRIDLRWDEITRLRLVTQLAQNFAVEAFASFKEEYPQDLMRGFYLVNKTDVLFPKLKNKRLQNRQGNFLGEILETEKGSHLAIMVRNARGLRKADKLQILHPKGETFEVPVHSLRNSALQEVESVGAGKLALIPYMNGVWVRSQVFLLE